MTAKQKRDDLPARGVLERLRRPSPRAQAYAFVAITILSAVYLTISTVTSGRDLLPKSHDEHSYAIQTRMLARGRLWMPQHSLADFFESFQMLARPVYASIYFPGSALMYVPGAWLSLPPWVMPAIVTGLALGLSYLLVTRLVDGVAGLLVVLLALAGQWFRLNATLVMSQSPMMLLGLGVLLAWLRWRETKQVKWAACIGACAGWAAIVRPVDALAFAIPVGAAMLLDFRGLPPRRIATTCAAVVLAALPFLSLQLVLNKGTTGDWLRTPHTLYLQTDQPGTTYGFHPFDAQARPRSMLAQKAVYYDGFMRPEVEKHRADRLVHSAWERVKLTVDVLLPAKVLLLFLVAGIFRLTDVPRAVVAAVPVVFFLLYLPYTFYMPHYVIPIVTPVLLLVVLGADRIAGFWTSAVAHRRVSAALTVALAALALFSVPELNPSVNDDQIFAPTGTILRQAIGQRIQPPAVVLVGYDAGAKPHDEPVYNSGVAWPDDAPVIFAHDLGARNVELLKYYDRTQPRRKYYRFDRKAFRLYGPATAAELAAAIMVRKAEATSRSAP
ncbi:MAG: hypothetical protein WBD40_03455 [Tepidisphaeraceae bacterium]